MELRRRFRVRALIALATAAQLLAISFGVSTILHSSPTDAAQQVPYKINFQGRLTDNSGNVLSDGLYNVKFRLWTLASGGSNVWEEDRVITGVDNRIQITNGLFNIQFGDLTALSPSLFVTGSGSLYLEVELPTPGTASCATNGCAVFTEGAMTPRQTLASSPYAMNSDTLDGLDSAAFGQLSANNLFTGANQFTPASGVGVTVRAASATHSLDVKDSSGSIQAYFDASGILNVGQTIQATAGTVDLGTSGSTFRTGYFGTSVQTPALNASTSGGTITTNLGTLQRVSSGTTSIDLKDAADTTLAVTNSGGGVAGISATGGLTIGTGKIITVGATAGSAVTCSSGQILDAIVVTGGVVTGGTCVAAGGGDKLDGTWTSQQAATATNTQTTINFTGGANSAPSFDNTLHILTLPSNASRLVITSKGAGGGGGGTGTAAVANKMAGGGAEGGYSQYTTSGSLPANYYLKVGSGGTPGATTPSAGGTGSSTCFGVNSGNACTTPLANATGGTGGTSSNVVCALVATVVGGSGTGDLTIPGANAAQNACTTATGVTLYSSAGGGAGGGKQLTTALGAGGTANSGIASSGGGAGGSWTGSGNGGNGGTGGSGYLSISVYVAVAGQGNPATLQTAYDNSTNPEIQLSGLGGLTVRDTSGGLGANLLEVQDNTGATNYLAVTSAGVSTSGTFTGNGSGLTNLTNLDPTNLVQGSGAVTLQSANATTLTLNSGTTGALNLATQGSAKTIQIGQTTAAVTDTIGIGNSAFAGSIDNITIGNQLTTSNTAIQGGTGTNAITLTPGLNGSVSAATTGAGTIGLTTATSVIVQSTTDSTTTFQVQNAASSTIFSINTTDSNPISKSGFETASVTPWAGLSAGTIAQDLTQHYVGYASGKVTAGTTAGGGVSQPLALSISTQYTLSFYAKLDVTSAALTTLQAGYSSTGLVGGEVDCTLNSTTVIAAGWSRYICTFTTPGTSSGTPYVYIQHNDATSEVFYIDAVQLDTGSFATPYGSGTISLNANINSPTNFQQSSNSTTAFQITNTAGTNILNVDTLNNNLNNQATNPSLETGTTGWAGRAGCTLTQDTTGGYNGTSSAKCVNTATANAGMNMTGIVPMMVNGTTYTISMYVEASANMTTLEIGHADNAVTPVDVPCLTAQTVTSLGWKRFTCTFTAGAQSGTPYIYVKQTDATVRTIWVDAVLLETDANSSTNYRDGRISLGNATISSPAVFQTNANSTTAFQIQNAAGIQVFNVDTASDTDLVANSGFEVNSVGWSLVNGASAPVRDTSKTYVGIASGKTTTTTTAGSGMRYTFATQLPAAFYTISAYVQTSAADATFKLGYNNGADTNCATIVPAASATVPSTTGWTRFVCTTATSAVLNSIYITSGTTAVTLNVDAVRVESGATATAFGNSNISFNGVFTSPVAIRNPNDTTTEFQVQTGASGNLLTVDSLNKSVVVGSNVIDASQILLQLDSNHVFADTATCSQTVNQGALYYNSNNNGADTAGSNTIRACVNGNWEDIMSTSGMGILAFGVIPDSGNAGMPGDIAGVSGYTNSPCKVVWGSATSVVVEPCTAYSGGRKVVVPSTTINLTGVLPLNNYANICLTGANNQPALGAASATESLAALPGFIANNPILCLATVRAAAASNIGFIWDTRTFTNTVKQFATINTTSTNGFLVVGTATAGVYGTTATTGATALRGVVVATSGAVATNTINAIIAIRGPTFVKFLSGGTAAINNVVETVVTTAGYGTSISGAVATAVLSNYVYGGPLEMGISTSCTTANTAASACQYSPLVDFSPTR